MGLKKKLFLFLMLNLQFDNMISFGKSWIDLFTKSYPPKKVLFFKKNGKSAVLHNPILNAVFSTRACLKVMMVQFPLALTFDSETGIRKKVCNICSILQPHGLLQTFSLLAFQPLSNLGVTIFKSWRFWRKLQQQKQLAGTWEGWIRAVLSRVIFCISICCTYL